MPASTTHAQRTAPCWLPMELHKGVHQYNQQTRTWLYSKSKLRYCSWLAATAATISFRLFTGWPFTFSTCTTEEHEERRRGEAAV